jgi:hypothetical protein
MREKRGLRRIAAVQPGSIGIVKPVPSDLAQFGKIDS